MTNNRSRTALVELSDQDFARIAKIEGLGAEWARLAAVSQRDLAKGVNRAVISVRTAMMRNHQPFAQSLSLLWRNVFVPALDAAENDISDENDDLTAAAWLAASLIGSAGAKAFLCALAESTFDVADEVARRLDQLCADADNPPAIEIVTDEDGGASTEDLPDSPHVDNDAKGHDTDASGASDALGADADSTAGIDIAAVRLEVQSLFSRGRELADELRAAADLIDAGRPVNQVTEVQDWSDSVRQLVELAGVMDSAVDGLVSFEEYLSTLESAQEGAEQRIQDATTALEMCKPIRGRDDMVDMVATILSGFGFESLAEAESIALSEIGTNAPERQTLPSNAASQPENPTDSDQLEMPEAARVTRELHEDVSLKSTGPSVSGSSNGANGESLDSGIIQEESVEAEPASATGAAENFDGLEDVAVPGEATAEGTLADKAGAATAARGDDVEDVLVGYIERGQFGAAWLIASAAGMHGIDVLAYRLAAAAFVSGPASIDPSEPLIDLTKWPQDCTFTSPESARVALAATIRAALSAGWIPRSELDAIVRQSNADLVIRQLTDHAVAACDRNYQHLQSYDGRLEISPDEAKEKATTLKNQLESSRITYTRANKVLKYLMRSSQALGEALAVILSDASGETRREALADSLIRLGSPDELIEAADEAVNTPAQRRNEIVAHARTALKKDIDLVTDCLREALRAEAALPGDAQSVAARDVGQRLVETAESFLETHTEERGPGTAALRCLAGWIVAPSHSEKFDSQSELFRSAALPLVNLERDLVGLPLMEHTSLPEVVEALASPASDEDLFEAYSARGDLINASAAANSSLELQDRLHEVRTRWTRSLAMEVAAVRAEIGRTFADDMTQPAAIDAEAGLVALDTYAGERFDLEVQRLGDMRVKLSRNRELVARELLERVRAEVDDEDQLRIEDLITKQDFVGANELLALARSGRGLPALGVGSDTSGAAMFEAFLSVLGHVESVHAKSMKDVLDILDGPTTAGTTRAAIDQSDISRLEAWTSLETLSQTTNRRGAASTMASVLRVLGLDSKGDPIDVTDRGVRHYRMYRVNATPVDGSLVPALGSQTNHYFVAVVRDAKQLRGTLESGFPASNGPNIVLFSGVLPLEERRKCLVTSRGQQITAIVADQVTAAFVAAYQPRSFKAVQQITLPFTCFSHYTVIAGNVPDEVFVGRSNELTNLSARDGSMFVYGGRQLGKSALLRKLQRDFGSVPDQHAIYIDLNSHGIGTWAEPSKLWPVLLEELVNVGGIVPKGAGSVRNPEPVIRIIRQWLDGKDSRRLLLLLDEADAFLDKESDAGGFENIGPLKRLFDTSTGRFKPVFAGLHKVQRLQNVANTPLAHGGGDTLVGPLDAAPARDLVVKPLEALGYRFANAESVWRLLAFTNLQAGLIQIVCNDLIKHLQSRPLHMNEPMVLIADSDIDAVTQNPQTRDRIAQKLRLTIALEDRYRVIALAVAIRSMEDSFREKYTAADIREDCEVYWQEGFEELNSSEFSVYLDELVGLGVLITSPDKRFSVRSPNIVTMLGTKEELITELDEGQQQFELSQEYNPQSARRNLDAPTDGFLRSPLSEYDLSLLAPVKNRYEAHNFVIFGSKALGVSEVGRVLKQLEVDRAVDVTLKAVTAASINEELMAFRFAGGGSSAPRLLVLDASEVDDFSDLESIVDAVQSTQSRQQGHLAIVFGRTGIPHVTEAEQLKSSGTPTTVIRLRKWTGAAIRAWHDNPFNSRADREQLLRLSGGWPRLVEGGVANVSNHGKSSSEEWDYLLNYPDDHAAASAFLDSAGVLEDDIILLSQWAHLGPAVFEPISDVAAVLERSPSELSALAADLEMLGLLNERQGGFALDAVVYRAIVKCNEPRP
jgi:hypothetical protein